MIRFPVLAGLLLAGSAVSAGAVLAAGAALVLLLLERGRRRGARELAEHRDRLQAALDEVEALRGLLPVCSHCRSIRDDEGRWRPMEEYIGARTGATFSHGICPDCLCLHYDETSARP